MEEKTLCKGLSVTAIVLIAISALILSFNTANSTVFGKEVALYGLPFMAAFAIPLLMILILLTRYIKSTDTVEDMIATIAVRYAIFGWFFVFVTKTAMIILNTSDNEFIKSNISSIHLIINEFNVCVIGTVALAIALKDIPAMKIEKRKMKIGQLLLLIMMMYGLSQIGSMMGLPVHLALSWVEYRKATGTDIASSVMLSSNTIVNIITVGILPAIFEELLFRKFLIDRTIRYGEFISCAMSGIMFGLWHGNFQQFFFTFFMGILFAFVYIRTGNIIYTMIMHASMNLVTTTVTLQLLTKMMEAMGMNYKTGVVEMLDGEEVIKALIPIMLLMLLWIALLSSFQIVGFIMLIVKRKNFKLVTMPGEPARKELIKKLTHSPFMWVFFTFALLLFVSCYLPGYLAYFFG